MDDAQLVGSVQATRHLPENLRAIRRSQCATLFEGPNSSLRPT